MKRRARACRFILEGYAKWAGKKTVSPGPFADPLIEGFCCQGCLCCLYYKELGLQPAGMMQPNGGRTVAGPPVVQMVQMARY